MLIALIRGQRFCLISPHSPSLDEPTREKLLHALASKLDSRGVLHITSQDTRSQTRNREAALARFVALLSSALEEQPERVATKPSAAVEEKRREEKKRHSRRKEDRGHDWSKDV